MQEISQQKASAPSKTTIDKVAAAQETSVRLMLTLAYNGKRYLGFQRQKNINPNKANSSNANSSKAKAVQNVLEECLTIIYGRLIKTIASGRTDRGVHADGQIVIFDLSEKEASRMSLEKLKNLINHFLPSDIRLLAIRKISSLFHPRHHATARHYQYRLLNEKSYHHPAAAIKAAYYPYEIDVSRLNQYLFFFNGTHDFSTFCSTLDASEKRIRHIYLSNAYRSFSNPNEIVIDFIGNAFLRSMIRSIVGNTLWLMKKGENPKIIKTMLEKKNPLLAKRRANPNGLTLVAVYYTALFPTLQIG